MYIPYFGGAESHFDFSLHQCPETVILDSSSSVHLAQNEFFSSLVVYSPRLHIQVCQQAKKTYSALFVRCFAPLPPRLAAFQASFGDFVVVFKLQPTNLYEDLLPRQTYIKNGARTLKIPLCTLNVGPNKANIVIIQAAKNLHCARTLLQFP